MRFGEENTSGTVINADAKNDQFQLAVSDSNGNQLCFINESTYTKDFDHATQTNPTLFIHSDPSPDTSNNQWGSLHHNQENFVITTGANVGDGTGATTIEMLSYYPQEEQKY